MTMSRLYIKCFNALRCLAFLLACALGAAYSLPCFGAPMNGRASTFTQPDGTQISLRFYGDEFYARTETAEGYTVVFDPVTKSYAYASLSADGRTLVATEMKVGSGNPQTLGVAKRLDIHPEERSAIAKDRFEVWDKTTGNSKRWAALKSRMQAVDQAALGTEAVDGPLLSPPFSTTVGTKVGLCLLIDFPDETSSIPQADVADFCNSDSYIGYGNNGSVKKYYQDVSNNKLTYTNTVTAYIRMAQPKSYYNNISLDCGMQGRLLINDALSILKALPNYNTEILPAFDALTVDSLNCAIACNVLFAGGDSGVWNAGLWPHSWSLAADVELSPGGKKIFKYQISNLGTALSLGTFCHESGHMLCGFPDMYDYGYDSAGGAGVFCLMNNGSSGANPVQVCAYLKRAAGWTTTIELNSSSYLTASLTSTAGHADFNKIYRYANPAAPTAEYFLFENRQKSGRDANIEASGIAIWHIDQSGNRDNQSLVPNTTHANYECSLIQADNLWHFQNNVNSGDSEDLYYLDNTAVGYSNTFNDVSSPDAHWWSGAFSGLFAYDFSSPGETMTFQFGLPTNMILVSHPNGGQAFYIATSQTISWFANITGNVKIELFKGGVFHSVLSVDEANDGSFSWTISADLPAGDDYSIMLSSVSNPSYTDCSDTVFSILVRPSLSDALDTPSLTWNTSSNASWFAQSTITQDGIDAAQSPDITHAQTTSLETTLSGPGTLTFWWKVNSQPNYDKLYFFINNVAQSGSLAPISGGADWEQKTVTIPTGSQTIKWSYIKNHSFDSGADCAWVDQVVFTPLSAAIYTVLYDANNATGGTVPASQTKIHDEILILATNSGNLYRTGYAFRNWNTAANRTGIYYAGGDKYSGNADLTLYAQWNPNDYIVTYDGNGSTSGSTADSLHFYDIAKSLTPNGFSRTGYTFAGWSTTSDNEAVYGDRQLVSNLTTTNGAKVMLYAKWRLATYSVTYHANGGIGTAVPAQIKTYDVELTLHTNTFSRTGYTFVNWVTATNGTGACYAPGAVYTNNGDVVMYAAWTNLYAVTYSANGATGGAVPGVQTKTNSVTLKLRTNSGALAKVGYTYAGWNTASNGTGVSYAAGASYTKNEPLSLYAAWLPATTTATLNRNGGTGGSLSVLATYDAAMPVATAPTRTGYSFIGYFDALTEGRQYYTATMLSAHLWDKAVATTLYAQWTGNVHQVTFNANGGSGGSVDVIATYGQPMPKAYAPVYNGFLFKGYFTAPSRGTQYYAADMASLKNWDRAVETTLHAQWTSVSVTATTVPVPFTWLAQYPALLSLYGGDYNLAANAMGANGCTVWESYVAGLNPTDPLDRLLSAIAITNGALYITWTPDLGLSRKYTILGKTQLSDAAWHSPTNPASMFYKVNVEMPVSP